MKQQRLTALACLAVITTLAACTNMPQHHERYAGHVIEGNADMVVNCKLLDSLSSSSGLTGFFAPKGVDNIKQNLLRQADSMGATHVVWDKPNVGYDATTLNGKAYQCPSADHPR
ncbi:MAG: hypothetical protein EPO09_04495 [Aquabacterium sp.]|uniref:hypothetical protein n=1 Tax=Aquabacterium sp. TaxID=1872578 RepID=UPI0011FB7FF3|nr:hypothetical protein [Aquabacterium sp.]TAK97262.1 MAG: hypothetical protein EPO09_04495 [Aquabacterium sp.]